MNMYDGKSPNETRAIDWDGLDSVICIKAYSMFYLDTKRDYLSR